MKIILLDNIEKLGSIGSEVIVKSGYARNFLIPKSKAIVATKKNLEMFNKQKFVIHEKFVEKQEKFKACAEVIDKIKNITIPVKSSDEGKIFGSISTYFIAKVITEYSGFKISKFQVRLPDCNSLKFVGVYDIKVHIYDKIFSTLKITVVNSLTDKKIGIKN